jgi:hypothetical protein
VKNLVLRKKKNIGPRTDKLDMYDERAIREK